METTSDLVIAHTSAKTGDADARGQIIKLWGELNSDERELLIPRLLYSTNLGERVRESGIAWRPAYMDREGSR